MRGIVEFLYEFEREKIFSSVSSDQNDDFSIAHVLSELKKTDFDFNPPLSCPILLEGLMKLITGEQYDRRYFDVFASDEEFEKKLGKCPSDVNLWINYAIAVLPQLSLYTLESIYGVLRSPRQRKRRQKII